MFVFAAFCGYFAACFALAALMVRAAPQSVSAQQIDQRLWLFPAMPLLLSIDLLVGAGEAMTRSSSGTIRLFERLTGKRHRGKKRVHYGYFTYGYTPRSSRKKLSVRRALRRPRDNRRRMRA